MSGESAGVQCCFCGEDVNSDNINPCDVVIGRNWDKNTAERKDHFFGVHFECFREKMHREMKPYLILDILVNN